MALAMSRQVMQLDQTRMEPSPKRVRAELGGVLALDTRRAVLVWEPRRVVPTYAVPRADVLASVQASKPETVDTSRWDRWPVWDPQVPFAAHTAPGREVTVSAGGRDAAGYLAEDSDLSELIILDFAAFDRWLEDDDEIISHPHDPFARIDVRRTSQHLRLLVGNEVVADSSNTKVLYETGLPPRHYWPRDDVIATLEPSSATTTCAYKGRAEYFTIRAGEHRIDDGAWAYPEPLVDATEVAGLVAFYVERDPLRLEIDGVIAPAAWTPFA